MASRWQHWAAGPCHAVLVCTSLFQVSLGLRLISFQISLGACLRRFWILLNTSAGLCCINSDWETSADQRVGEE